MAFEPPLLNSSNRWATTHEDLQALYRCPATGAVTIRTSMLNGFEHRDEVHQYCFFDPSIGQAHQQTGAPSSLNTLGYCPVPLPDYVEIIRQIEIAAWRVGHPVKPVIFSVTGSATEVASCLALIAHQKTYDEARWLMEINLSCPNIPGKPPPAYSRSTLTEYLHALQDQTPACSVPIGLKLPPFTYQDQFDAVIGALLDSQHNGRPCPISFLTSTNTLGSCLVFGPTNEPALSSADGSGIGGLAGPALHPLALGNVRRLRTMLDAEPSLRDIIIIGVGGVHDNVSFERMIAAGAAAVGVGTAFGAEGIGVFSKILKQGSSAEHVNGQES